MLYNIEKESYEEAQTLAKKLDHTSIEQALAQIDLNSIDNDINTSIEDNIDENKNQDEEKHDINNDSYTDNNKESIVETKYITTYDTSTQKYVVYSTADLLDVEETLESENDKIERNEELTSFYDNLSVSKIDLKQIGIILFISAIMLICATLVIMYKKNLKKIGK